MERGNDYDVLIVGGGIVGVTLAAALASAGMRVALVDRGAAPAFRPDRYDLRVSAISRASERVLATLGVWQTVVAWRVSPFQNMHVWDSGSRGAIEFDAAEVGEPCLGHIVENSAMVAAVHERLERESAVARLFNAQVQDLSVEPDRVRLRIAEAGSITAGLLVGADGSGSWVRTQLGIGETRSPYHQQAIVAQVATELPHRHTAWQRFLATGPLAFLPLGNGDCSIVWSCDDHAAERLLALDDDAFSRELSEAFEYRLGAVTTVGARRGFPLVRAHAASYVGPRSVLVGDAAHTVHPLAGQGANLGIVDAAALAQVVVGASRRGGDIGSPLVLRRYERWRKGENLLMMTAFDGLQRLFGSRSQLLRRVRGLGLSATNHSGPVKREIIRRAMGLSGDLPDLARGRTLTAARS